MIALIFLPVRIGLAICLYSVGLVCMITVIGIPIGLTCFALARELLVMR